MWSRSRSIDSSGERWAVAVRSIAAEAVRGFPARSSRPVAMSRRSAVVITARRHRVRLGFKCGRFGNPGRVDVVVRSIEAVKRSRALGVNVGTDGDVVASSLDPLIPGDVRRFVIRSIEAGTVRGFAVVIGSRLPGSIIAAASRFVAF